MKKLTKVLLIFTSTLISLIFFVIITSPFWVKPLIYYILEKNFGNYIRAEDVRYIFPNKLQISTLEIGGFASFSNASISLQNLIKLSPINIELTKPKITIIHNEKGEWIFPQIPGIDTSKPGGSGSINVEIKAKIKDGIVIVRDLRIKKDIEIGKVNGDLSWKNQVITYSVSTFIDNQQIKSYGNYDFSNEKGSLTFEFKNALANVWAPIFLSDIFQIEKGYFTGWINTQGEKSFWSATGEINASKN